MATAAEVAAHRRSQADVVALAQRDLTRWWATVDDRSPDALVAALEGFVPDLVATYGDVAALIAADWYDDLRAASGATGTYRAAMAAPASAEQASAVARWAAGSLFGDPPNPARVLSLLSGGVQRLVLQPGRATIATSAMRDPAGARWARVPSGKTCAFCLMLASRGAVYESKRSAGGQMRQFHSLCDCTPTPVWPGQAEPYDVDALYEQYAAARAAAGSGDPKAILAELRANGDVSDSIRRVVPFAQRVTGAASGSSALSAARFGLGRPSRPVEFTAAMSRAVNTYTGAEYGAVNRHLRGQILPYGYAASDVTPVIADLDSALAASTLGRDVVVHRGLASATLLFGDRLGGSLVGMQWREDAYLSTTANPNRAAGFASASGDAPMVMRILAPAGTHAIEASGMALEAEVLMARGLRLRVVEDRGIGPDGRRHIDVEVLG